MGKGNVENLRSADKLTEEELRRMASNGGKASVEARRRKKMMREALEQMMYDVELSPALKKKLQEEGIREEDMNHQFVITRSLIAKAEQGDVQAYNTICAMIGEKPAEKLEMSGGMDNKIQIEFVSAGNAPLAHSEDEVDTERR